MVVLVADGMAFADLAATVGSSRRVVSKWVR